MKKTVLILLLLLSYRASGQLFYKIVPILSGDEIINPDPIFTVKTRVIEDSWMYGSFRTLAKPSMLWYNGSTYSLWYKENDFNNQVGIIKQTGKYLESSIVNDGTISSEPINHPAPMLHINKTTGYIYVLQNKLHLNRIRVWKSQTPEDISQFNYVGEFGQTNNSYLGNLEGDESDVVIQTRAGVEGVDNFSMSVIKVNLDTLVYTQTLLTFVDEPTTDSRHYLLVPYQYGTSTKTFFGIAHRNEVGSGLSGYYKFSLLVTNKGGDYEVFENIAGTFSKDVVATSVISNAELEANYAAIGTDASRSTMISEGKMIVLNNDVYIVWMSDDANSRFSVRKFTYGSGSFTDFLIPVTTIAESPIWYGPVYMRYNGTNFVFTIAEHDGSGGYITKIYACNTDFTNWTEFNINTFDNSTVPEVSGYFYGMPTNLNDVDGEYLIIGKNKDLPAGGLIYTTTFNKWNTPE